MRGVQLPEGFPESCEGQMARPLPLLGSEQLPGRPPGPAWPPWAPTFQTGIFAPITLPLLHQRGGNEPAFWFTRRAVKRGRAGRRKRAMLLHAGGE